VVLHYAMDGRTSDAPSIMALGTSSSTATSAIMDSAEGHSTALHDWLPPYSEMFTLQASRYLSAEAPTATDKLAVRIGWSRRGVDLHRPPARGLEPRPT
jgi:hypothetical protein